MATTVTLHPNGTVSNSGWVVTGASAHAALADPSGSNYVTASGTLDDSLRLNMETYALAADEKAKRVRIILNVAKTADLLEGIVAIGSGEYRLIAHTAGGVHTLTSGWQTPTDANDITGITQAEIDACELEMNTDFNNAGDYCQAYEARVQIEVIDQPIVSFSASAYVLHRPVMTVLPWVYTGNGEAAYQYQAKIFLAADVGVGGFDPDVDTPEIDSGIVTSSDDFYTANGLAYDTEYIMFVKVAKNFNGVAWFSEWAQSPSFFTHSLPLATSILPNSAAVTTNLPKITWVMTPTAADENPDPVQFAYYVRIFKEPGGGWGVVNPDDTESPDLIEDSGYIESATASFQTNFPLPNNTNHRVYIKLIRTSGWFNPPIEGVWAFQGFTTDFITPAVPLLSTAPHANGVDVEVTVSPGLKNLMNLNQSTMATSVLGYETTVANSALVHSTDYAAHGSHSMRIDKTVGAGTVDVQLKIANWRNCTAGLSYAMQCSVRKAAGQAARSVRVGIRWWDAANALISTSWSSGVNDSDTWTVRSAVANAPTGAVKMSPVWEVASQGLSPEFHYVDKVMIEQTNVVNTWHVGDTAEEQYYVMQRRAAGGPWEYFSTGDGQMSDHYVMTTEPFTVVDREVVFNKLVEYRASAVGTPVGLTEATQSSWSIISAETLQVSQVWVKDLELGIGFHFYTENDWLEKTQRMARSVYEPLGRSLPIVIRGQAQGQSWPHTFVLLGEDSKNNLMSLLESNKTLFLQTPKGNYHVEVAGDLTISEHLWDSVTEEEDVWKVTVPWLEVAP